MHSARQAASFRVGVVVCGLEAQRFGWVSPHTAKHMHSPPQAQGKVLGVGGKLC